MSVYLNTAKAAARMAGDFLAAKHSSLRRWRVRFKKNNELVTSLDDASERMILRVLKRRFPTHSYVAEESGKDQMGSDMVWYIDPLDGTSNYVMGNPLYGVSIALAMRGEVMLGVLYFPELPQRMLWAEKEKGTWCDGKRIRVSTVANFPRAPHTFCHGKRPGDLRKTFALYRSFLPRHIRLRHFGSAAYELAQVALGNTDSYLSVGISPWDIAAGVCIVREAGGTVTDGKGGKWHLGIPTMAASNGKVHGALIRSLHGVV